MITFYKSTAEPNRVNKASYLSDAITMSTGQFRESANKMTCSIRIQYAGTLNGYNYVYISDFSRYYFVTEHTIERTGVHRFELKTDVLYTNKTDILAASGIIARNQHNYNARLIDDRLRFLGYKVVKTQVFHNEVRTNDCYILAVNGGGAT